MNPGYLLCGSRCTGWLCWPRHWYTLPSVSPRMMATLPRFLLTSMPSSTRPTWLLLPGVCWGCFCCVHPRVPRGHIQWGPCPLAPPELLAGFTAPSLLKHSSLCLLPAKPTCLDFLLTFLKAPSPCFLGFFLPDPFEDWPSSGFSYSLSGQVGALPGHHHILLAGMFKLTYLSGELGVVSTQRVPHSSPASHNYLTLGTSPLYHSQQPLCWQNTHVLLTLPAKCISIHSLLSVSMANSLVQAIIFPTFLPN